MARGIKWQIKFKSLSNVNCSVNIYLEGFTGTPLQLLGGANPVYWEEDNTDNLLQVVRIKTGYISFIEETFGQWNEVYPTTNNDRYIEVVYGNSVMFTGFLQAQSFETGWVAPPREIQIPIISVLGITKSIKLQHSVLGSGVTTTGKALANAIALLNTTRLDRIKFPNTSGTDSSGNIIPQITLNEKIRMGILCPYNNSYDRTEHSTDDDKIYSPVTVYELLEGICNAYGWILHDTPTELVFTKHDYTGNYMMRLVSTLTQEITPYTLIVNALNLNDYLAISSDQGVISDIMPVRRIELNYNTNVIDKGYMNFDRCAAYLRFYNTNGRLYYFLTPMSDEFGGSLLRTMSQIAWDSSSKRLSNDGCYITFASQQPGEYGSPWEEVGKGILIQWSTNWEQKTNLFWVRLPYPAKSPTVSLVGPGGSSTGVARYVIELELAWAQSMTSGYVGEYFRSNNHDNFTIDMGIRNQNGQWLDGSGNWGNTETFRTITIDGSNGKIYKDQDTQHIDEFLIDGPIQDNSLFFVFRTNNNDNLSDHEPIFFKTIGWKPLAESFFPELFERPADKYFDSNNGSEETADVTQFLTPYSYSENLIGDDRVNAKFTEYPYMFVAQKNLQVDSRHALPGDQYLHPYSYSQKKWKMLAVGFSPRNDEYRLTLHTY